MPATEEQLGLLGLTKAQLDALLDELDKAAREETATQKRRSERKPFRSVNVRVSVVDRAGNSEVSFRVPTRNLSLHGLAFLHQHMMPVGQLLEVEIPFKKGYTVRLLAQVVRCRHVRGMIHEIGVEFKGKLNREAIPARDSSSSADGCQTKPSDTPDTAQ